MFYYIASHRSRDIEVPKNIKSTFFADSAELWNLWNTIFLIWGVNSTQKYTNLLYSVTLKKLRINRVTLYSFQISIKYFQCYYHTYLYIMLHSSSYTYFTNEHSLRKGKYVLINKLFVFYAEMFLTSTYMGLKPVTLSYHTFKGVHLQNTMYIYIYLLFYTYL